MSTEKEFVFEVRIKTSNPHTIKTLDEEVIEHSLILNGVLGPDKYETEIAIKLVSVRDTDPREE